MEVIMPKHYYGWKPDKPDDRDLLYRAPVKVVLPSEIDLREYCSPVRDQGNLGSCTAFAMGTGLREFIEMKTTPPTPPPQSCLSKILTKCLIGRKLFPMLLSSFELLSPLFLYYEERILEGTVDWDSGAMIRDGMKVLAKTGICPETDWPYNIRYFTQKPPQIAYDHAPDYKIFVYTRILNLTDIKTALATGNGVVFGFLVFESFETEEVANTGIMPMPEPGEQVLGGHAIFVCGYKDDPEWAGGGYLIIKNSWSANWGDNGYFYMPYAFASNPVWVNDIWTATY
jgi:C1A family cysteine protease